MPDTEHEVLLTESELDSYMRAASGALAWNDVTGKPTNIVIGDNEIDLVEGPIDITSALINLIYPVGSIYLSVNAVNPSTIFPNTYWVQVTDTFLYASDKNITTGLPATPVYPVSTGNYTSIGGRKDLALVSHTHTKGTLQTNNPSTSLKHTHGPNDGTHYVLRDKNIGDQGRRQLNSNSSGSYWTWMSTKADGLISQTTTGVSGTLNHAHPITGSTALAGTVTAGTNTDNMPPYMPVYVWKRVESI